MRVFLTGANGFIGSRVLRDLLAAGHEVIGNARSDHGARRLEDIGCSVHRGDLADPAGFARGAETADAVIHTAFDHEFSRFVENCEKEARVLRALGDVLAGSDRPLLITSGTGMGSPGPGERAREDVFDRDNPNPRRLSELTGEEVAARGVSVAVVRLPQVHDPVRQGLISPLIDIALAKGELAYVGDGAKRWPAAHVDDVARLYRLALNRHQSGARWHAVAEEGVTLHDISETLGERLGLPVRSIAREEAQGHFGWMAMFVMQDLTASSAWTRERLDWVPTGPTLLEDLAVLDRPGAVTR